MLCGIKNAEWRKEVHSNMEVLLNLSVVKESLSKEPPSCVTRVHKPLVIRKVPALGKLLHMKWMERAKFLNQDPHLVVRPKYEFFAFDDYRFPKVSMVFAWLTWDTALEHVRDAFFRASATPSFPPTSRSHGEEEDKDHWRKLIDSLETMIELPQVRKYSWTRLTKADLEKDAARNLFKYTLLFTDLDGE